MLFKLKGQQDVPKVIEGLSLVTGSAIGSKQERRRTKHGSESTELSVEGDKMLCDKLLGCGIVLLVLPDGPQSSCDRSVCQAIQDPVGLHLGRFLLQIGSCRKIRKQIFANLHVCCLLALSQILDGVRGQRQPTHAKQCRMPREEA